MPLIVEGLPQHEIVVSERASERVQDAARTLADYLTLIAEAPFEVVAGSGACGIAVGTATDFPALRLTGRFRSTDASRREEYLLQSSPNGLWLIGANELAVEHAVWDFYTD